MEFDFQLHGIACGEFIVQRGVDFSPGDSNTDDSQLAYIFSSKLFLELRTKCPLDPMGNGELVGGFNPFEK